MTAVGSVRLDPVVEFVSISCAQQKVQSVVSLRTEDEVPGDSERAKVMLSAVADRSGSMQERRKLDLVKDSITFLVRELRARDSFGLVDYDHNVRELSPLLPVCDEQRVKIKSSIASLSPGGRTNISGGLLQGILQHQRQQPTKAASSSAPEIRAVFLFTDGLANVGVCTTPELVRAMNGALESVLVANLNVFTFGFGNDHDESMLSELAKASGGSYYFIESPESIPEAFADALGGLLSVVGQNMELVIHPASGLSIKVRTSYPTSEHGDDGSIKVLMGDIYSGETRDVVVEADVPAGMEDAMLWTAELRYFDLISNRYQNHNCCAPIVTRGAGNREPVPASNGAFEYVAQHRRRVDATAAIDEGVRLADCGEMKEASEHLKQFLDNMDKAPQRDAITVGIQRDLRQMVGSVASAEKYYGGGRKIMMHRRMEHAHQRAAASGISTKSPPRKYTPPPKYTPPRNHSPPRELVDERDKGFNFFGIGGSTFSLIHAIATLPFATLSCEREENRKREECRERERCRERAAPCRSRDLTAASSSVIYDSPYQTKAKADMIRKTKNLT
eukprot:CAMPEP_0114231252 /NCGR_PEP_ID=MMETSP0058-20121206/3935_1 /TAXON_ID=36894 /ORGANISM="Pyramimonas parkeae, CCMP726" /LENGTH=561 /DNA_ID=CAMNT_0001342569 /DNA_START=148 /DNA_END=1833 /DNA_ORIENTATION=-